MSFTGAEHIPVLFNRCLNNDDLPRQAPDKQTTERPKMTVIRTEICLVLSCLDEIRAGDDPYGLWSGQKRHFCTIYI
eukprot:COSAG06_NODE_6431_length_2935_cov_2.705924_1_plen_77_part_00